MRSGWRRRARSEEDIRRKPGTRSPRQVFLVVCEDSKSSPAYFKALRGFLRLSTAQIEVCGDECGSAPISVVDHAIRRREERRVEQNPVDVVFCVFDVDTHPSLHKALDKAKGNGLVVALSSPCFELWYLLHFAQGGKPYSNCDQLVRDLKKHIEDYNKGSFGAFDILWSNMQRAIGHGKRLIDLRGEDRLRNPSTEVHLVVEAFLAEAQSGAPPCASVAMGGATMQQEQIDKAERGRAKQKKRADPASRT